MSIGSISPEAPEPLATRADLEACHAAIRVGSRTFHAASRLLPERVRGPALSLYAFCREADDAIDQSGDPRAALRSLEDRLDRAYRREPIDNAADRALALLFLAVIASGVAGHVLQAILPARLARSGPELIYERIPTEVAKLRAAAEDALVEAAGAAGHETLSSYYAQTLAWYFERPRFALSHVFGGHSAEAWERQRLAAVEKLLSADERPHLAALAELCRHKRAVDAQYALQTLLRAWTFVHVPAATAFLAMAAWHTLIVHVYAG